MVSGWCPSHLSTDPDLIASATVTALGVAVGSTSLRTDCSTISAIVSCY